MNLTAIAVQAFGIAIFAMMVSIGLRTRPADSLHLMRHWRKGVKAFVALFVIAPAAMILLALLLPMPPAAEVALIALSVSPMLPTLPNDLAKLGADHRYCISLEIVGALMALIAAPIVFWIVSRVARVDIDIGTGALLASLAKGVFFPLAIGVAVAIAFPALAARMGTPIVAVASIVLLCAVLVILWSARRLILAQLDWQILLSIVLLVLVGLAAGHALGGPEEGDRRALALTAASRHVGFAIAVGAAVAPKAVATVIGVALVYLVARGLLVLPYTKRAAATAGGQLPQSPAIRK